MNRFSLCLLPLLLITAGCLSSIDDEDYKPFTTDRWREMIKDNENRLKPEEQRPIQGLDNPIRLFIGAIAEGISWLHDLATGHDFFDEARKLLDSNPDHRRSGVVYLSDRSPGRHDPYLKQYMNMARTDPDPSVRSMAIRALNRARDKRAIPIFLAALDEKNDSVRLEGAKGLANIPDPTAVAPLIRHLDNLDENVDVRVACADALRLYRTSEVAQALVRGLRDRNFGIAWQSRKSLQLMTGKDFRYDTAAWLTYLSGTNKPFG
ncbi:MAG TPA: HEAT repeat domain-containing protein [Tepidisphaeraceae bacterium]|nr:HEAT repeat domain-containing protein [Tepidisphaeraceae bacterium]